MVYLVDSMSKNIPVEQPELVKLEKFIHLIGSRTRDLPVYSIVPQSLRYRVLATEH
jgi:hypothetical protein